MSIELMLTIISFAISIGGLVPVFTKKEKKAIIYAMVISALIAVSAISLWATYQHNKNISEVEEEIIKKISNKTLTFDQIYEEVYFKSFSLVNEALFNGVKEQSIGDSLISLRGDDNSMIKVRVYYVRQKQ